MTTKKIHWNGFLEHAVKEYPKEAAGFLFSRKPYSSDEEWFVFSVRNIYADPKNGWIPDKKDMHRVKAKAMKMGLVKIGNVHTHPYPEDIPYNEETMQNIIQPSDDSNSANPGLSDLKFARKFNDVIRGILCVGKDSIYDIYFHDKFGNKIDVRVVEE